MIRELPSRIGERVDDDVTRLIIATDQHEGEVTPSLVRMLRDILA